MLYQNVNYDLYINQVVKIIITGLNNSTELTLELCELCLLAIHQVFSSIHLKANQQGPSQPLFWCAQL